MDNMFVGMLLPYMLHQSIVLQIAPPTEDAERVSPIHVFACATAGDSVPTTGLATIILAHIKLIIYGP